MACFFTTGLSGMAGGSINFGMWKFCLTTNQEQQDIHLCPLWKGETTFHKDTGMLKTLESEGITLSILLGCISSTIFFSLKHLILV